MKNRLSLPVLVILAATVLVIVAAHFSRSSPTVPPAPETLVGMSADEVKATMGEPDSTASIPHIKTNGEPFLDTNGKPFPDSQSWHYQLKNRTVNVYFDATKQVTRVDTIKYP